MKRRRLIAIISLCTLAVMGLIVAVAGVVVMRTDMARNFVQARLAGAINGRVYVGRISGNPFSGLTIDSLAIRDTSGEMVVSTGRLSFDYDIRDLADQRIHLRHLSVEHPHVHLRDFGEGRWNYQTLSRRRPGPKVKAPGRTWGDFLVVDSLRATNASFFLSLPWSPDDTLRGAARDSAVRYALNRKDRRIAREPRSVSGFSRTYMWTRARALVSHARLTDPDSNRFGQEIHVSSLDANEFDPPFVFRNVRGVIRRLGDSVWLDLAHWDLPGSTGSARGKVVWGSDLPMRYDIVVRGDSMSLADVNWVYPTLPKTGGGSMILRISNRRNLRVMDYHLDSMNVRSTGSHLIGEMTFGVGGPVLQLRNVNLRANPVDFALIEAINGKPFPIDWQGQIFGDVRAPGGPLNDFDVASARGEWRDTHVRGAVSRLSGSGGLNIQYPAFAKFHDFDLDVQALDLRSIQFLFPAFPRLNGTIAGRATLDSIWTDLRFSDADIIHRDGPGTPSRFTGSGRVTDGSPFITYDVDLIADPLSFDMLARSFPRLTLRGLAYGPVKIKGQSPDLQVVTNLVSAAGTLRFAGNIDIDSLGGYGARGVGELRQVNLARLGVRTDAPTTSLSGRYSLDVRGATPATLTGVAEVRLDSSTYDRIRLDSASRATVRFENGRVITSDTLVIRSPIGLVKAFGALGLPGGGTDSVNVTLALDTLGGLRPYFTERGTPAAADSLGGRLTVNGIASGRLDSLLMRGVVAGDSLFVRGIWADSLRGTFSFADVLGAPSGRFDAVLGGTKVGGLRFDSLAATVNVLDTTRATFALGGRAFNGDSLRLGSSGAWARLAGATAVRVDSFALGFASALWTLRQPVTLTSDDAGIRVDSLDVRSARGASIGLAGVSPLAGSVDLRLSASQVPLFDLNRVIGQAQAPVAGFANLSARMSGTRDFPLIEARTALDSIAISGVQIGRLSGSAQYANNRASVSADIFQAGKRVLHAVADSLPLAIRWLTYDTLPGRVRATAIADSADFTLIQAWVDYVSNVTGKISGNLTLDGTWRQPNLLGQATLADGAMRVDTLGIALSRMFGHVQLRNDTLTIDSLTAQSGGPSNTARLAGRLTFRETALDGFDVTMAMNDFLAYDRPELATIYARTNPDSLIHLFGKVTRSDLRGEVFVDRGAIYLPDPKFVGKRFSALDSLSFTAPREKTLFERITDSLNTRLTAHLGGDFKLSADYADISLSGDLNIVPVASTDVARRSSDYISRLAPVGTINADRGTYDLLFQPIFRKSFEVQPGGTITFDRDAQWNGLLNVSARYVVRKPGRPDVPIIVDVTDRLLTPRVRPRSESSFPISESDLISYIVFDEPGFDLVGVNRQGAALSSIFAPIATSAGAELLREELFRGWIDQLRFETATLNSADGSSASLLYTTRLRGGKELVPGKLYVSLSAGLCTLDQQFRQNRSFGNSLRDQLGGSFDYRLRSSLTGGASWQVSLEPSTQALLCSDSYQGSEGVAPTPKQYSLSFLKYWRW